MSMLVKFVLEGDDKLLGYNGMEVVPSMGDGFRIGPTLYVVASVEWKVNILADDPGELKGQYTEIGWVHPVSVVVRLVEAR